MSSFDTQFEAFAEQVQQELREGGLRGVSQLLDAHRQVEYGGKARHAFAQLLLHLFGEGFELGVERAHGPVPFV